ncbi:MAG: hypothetical protein ACKV19_12235, partial [Verrucomicrobiales bacterium]
ERAGNFRLWINGVDRTANLQPNVTGWGINTDFAKIGGRRDDPTDTTTHSGAQDEVAIWLNRVLTPAEVAALWRAARPELPAYPKRVIALNPTYYYQLNETVTDSGVADAMGNAPAPGTYNGDYLNGPSLVGGPGATEVFGATPVPGLGGMSNVAHYSNNAGHIILGDNSLYGANAITVALFLKAGGSQGGDRIFTNNLVDPTKSFQIVTGNDGLVLAVDPSATGVNAERTLFLEDNSGPDRRLIDPNAGWFHVVASTFGTTGPERAGNFQLLINGVNRTANLQPNVVGWGVETDFAKIGGRGPNATAPQTHSGAQDEVAIWLNRALSETEAKSLWSAATGSGGPVAPLRITQVTRNPTTADLTLVFSSVTGSTYAVDRSSNLAAWTELTKTLMATGAETTYTDSSAEVHAAGLFYYRVRKVQ